MASDNNKAGKVVPIKPTSKPQKATHTTVDTIMFDRETAEGWLNPPFQRPMKVNEKVRNIAEEIREDGGVVPGVLTLGVLLNDRDRVYLLDGQHRRHAYLLSGCATGYADVRTHYFENMAAMGEEFVRLNSQIVRLKPDDILRGLEGTVKALGAIRGACPFVGYDMIRRSDKSPIVSMSALLRCWIGSKHDVPTTDHVGWATLESVLTDDSVRQLVAFLQCAIAAWGRDDEYGRLWGNLNLAVCMWLYRRTVITQHSTKTPALTDKLFTKCLMSLSTDSQYLEWLVARRLGDRDRRPCYQRIKVAFTKRLHEETKRKALLPQPAWA